MRDFQSSTVTQRFGVDFTFPVHFTRGVFAPANRVLRETVARVDPDGCHRLLFVVDDNVAGASPSLRQSILDYVSAHQSTLELAGDTVSVPGGETAKNGWGIVVRVLDAIREGRLDRHSVLVVIGGGAVLDMGCFAASLAHRGVRSVRLPTTVLSQADSGVGVKNGINLFDKKNFVGIFEPPFGVINDGRFIETLPLRDRRAGVAEAVKVALLRDPEFFAYLEEHAERLAGGDLDILERVVRVSAGHHIDHIGGSGDPFERGSGRPLDFGHWSAHCLESLSGYRLRHGEAVAVGIAIDTVYAAKAGLLAEDDAERILALIDALGLPTHDDTLSITSGSGLAVLSGLEEFREHLGGELQITLLEGIGRPVEVFDVNERLVIEAIGCLRARPRAAVAGPQAVARSAGA